MTVPQEYSQASRDFEQILVDVRDHAMISTTHRAFTTLEAVLCVFRRRLTVAQGLEFSGLLKVGLRALFITDWDVGEPVLPFETMKDMQAEVMSLRHNHNLSPPTAINDVVMALRLHIDEVRLVAFLKSVSPHALIFWGFDESGE